MTHLENPLLSAALALARRGLHVFPCMPRQKTPATSHGCLDATTNTETITGWWSERPDYNLAVATGKVSGVYLVDIDGEDAELELRKLEAEHDELPATVEAITARGRHIYFKAPDSPIGNTAGKIAPGIDTRGSGGYVLAPPSIHPSGRAYTWSVDCAKRFAPLPEWLLAKISKPGGSNGKAESTPAPEWRALVAQGVGEGQRDCSATKLAGYLLRHYIDPLVAFELLRLWNADRCRPPLPEEDIKRIINSIASREIERRYGRHAPK